MHFLFHLSQIIYYNDNAGDGGVDVGDVCGRVRELQNNVCELHSHCLVFYFKLLNASAKVRVVVDAVAFDVIAVIHYLRFRLGDL